MNNDVYVISAVRTAVGKAPKGTLRNARPDDMAAVVIKEAILRTNLSPDNIDDVILGCAMPEGEQGMNVARISSFKANLPHSVPAMTVNRFCASGLESIAIAVSKIKAGLAECVVAGGAETMSLIPMGGNKIVPNPTLVDSFPEVYLGMGLTAERVSEKFSISREMQDEFAYKSHMKANQALQNGKSRDEIVPLLVRVDKIDSKGKVGREEISFDVDEGPRLDTTIEALSRLKPAFKQNGTVTAGNSSQMSDGAAAVILASAKAIKKLNLTPIGRFVSYSVAGVPPDIMGIGPVYAIPKALNSANLKLKDIDIFELNEAFAAQSLACIKELELDSSRVNVNGGAIALGHPLGCTGAKLTVSALYELKKRNAKYAAISMCIGGGMGACGIFERA